VNNAEGFETIPPQAQDIVRSIRDISRYDQFIPNGIRDEFTSLFKHPADIKDRFFTTSTVIAADGSKQDLLEDLKTMQRICSKAKESTRLERHEAAWNSAVHQPLLDLAFEDRKELGQGVRARVENIACATVAGDCVPRWSSAVCKKYNASVGAWSVSQETASSTSSTGSTGSTGSMGSIEEEEDPFLMGPQLDSTSHSRVGSRKVDFAVVLEAPPDSALENEIYAVLDLLLETPLLSRSISPSTYRPLVESPIAIAIETKTVTATRDPLLQLGLFAAAIHRRLHTLPVVNATGACPVTKTGVIVTLPLIAVTNHRWEIYFACDRGDKIVCHSHPCLFTVSCRPICFRWTDDQLVGTCWASRDRFNRNTLKKLYASCLLASPETVGPGDILPGI
jgi:hypothetical protein